MPLSPRLHEALSYAATLHADQQRKASGEPYLAHLLAVAALVMEYGGNEDETIAALLHDAVEDQGGMATLAEIRRRFGAGRGRDRRWLHRHGRDAQAAVAAAQRGVHRPAARRARPRCGWSSAADKLHNARSILREYRRQGESVWGHFRGGRDGTLWYYRAVVDTLKQAGATPLVEEFGADRGGNGVANFCS